MNRAFPSESGTSVLLQNSSAILTLDLFGGAITGFYLLESGINPLSFRFSREQMPENNRAGAPYQGHFLCLGRWGEPSVGELKAGMPNHGQFANILWELEQDEKDGSVSMTATAPLEGLHVSRSLQLDAMNAAFAVEEQLTNIHPLGRVYNMVQHPTLGRPFLSNTTQVNCNAATGFNQQFSDNPEAHATDWPMGYTGVASENDLRVPDKPVNGVYSFIVDKASRIGWITAYSPIHHTVLGYVWKREDYPWIHLWQHWSGKHMRYRGLEFGTAGIHRPFREILTTVPRVFDEATFAYIDAGETITRRYLSFLLKVEEAYAGVGLVEIAAGRLRIKGKHPGQDAWIETSFKDFL